MVDFSIVDDVIWATAGFTTEITYTREGITPKAFNAVRENQNADYINVDEVMVREREIFFEVKKSDLTAMTITEPARGDIITDDTLQYDYKDHTFDGARLVYRIRVAEVDT